MNGSKYKSVAVLLALLAGVVPLYWYLVGPDPQKLSQEINRHYLRAEYESAAELASRYLEQTPADSEVRLIAAQSNAARGLSAEALEHLAQLQTQTPELQIEASLLEAEIVGRQMSDPERAEKALRRVLELDPQNVDAIEQLAQLLAACGQRRAALPYILQLVQRGYPSDLLTIAARSSGAIDRFDLLQKAVTRHPNSPLVLVGLAMNHEQRDNLDAAIRYCRMTLTSTPGHTPAIVRLGQCLLADGRFDELDAWETQLSEDCEQSAECWRVRGYLALERGDQQQALKYFLNANRLGPDIKDVYHQIAQLLYAADDKATARRFAQGLDELRRLQELQDRMFATGPGNPDVMPEMVRQFQTLGRLWEARGWAELALSYQESNLELQRLRAELVRATANLPLQLVPTDFGLAAKIDADQYSLPTVTQSDAAPESIPNSTRYPREFAFQDDAGRTGIDFSYINGVKGPTEHRMYEFSGGGIGVCDYDHDGLPDLYFSQGSLWQNRNTPAAESDQLYRNRRGTRFSQVTSQARIKESGFGQGVAVGDINSDGFADIFVSNIGSNEFWINNGDGTFTSGASLLEQSVNDDNQWTTSALIADLNQDGISDILAANYLRSIDVFDRICTDSDGNPQACFPSHFDATPNDLWLGQPDGSLKREAALPEGEKPGKSLGLLAWSPAGDGVVSVFITNDTTPNELLQLNDEFPSPANFGYSSGLAVSGMGKAEGCMGIAAGDADEDGFFDLLVTNFYNESNTFYRSEGGPVFRDATAEVNLESSSLAKLGFGTQFIDADLNGDLELFITNGHVDDLRRHGKPYQMSAQLLQRNTGRYEETNATTLGNYFRNRHLGRSATVLDWNLDGRPDIAVGHLYEPYALLTNMSVTENNALCLHLIGTQSARDAVGATVSVLTNGRQLVRQVTAGDGYHSSNERRLIFGCGNSKSVDVVTIKWPSGITTRIEDVATGQNCVIREGTPQIFTLP